MPRVLRFASAVFAAILLTQCAIGPAGRTPSPRSDRLASLGYEPLPLKKSTGDSRYSGRFRVNGKEVRFLIDSGANSTDLDYELATSFGITPEKSVKVVSRGALGRPVTSWVGLGALGAGHVTATPFPFMLAQPTKRHTATSRYDGQMGLDALSGLAALVDLQAGKLWIPGPQAKNAQRGGIRALGRHKGLGFDSLQLETAGRLPHLLVRCRYQGKRLTWVVDTGFGDGLFEPIMLTEQSFSQRGFDFSLRKTKDGYWRLENHRFGGAPSFDFVSEPANEDLLNSQCYHLQQDEESPFVLALTCQRFVECGYETQLGRVAKTIRPEGVKSRLINSADELVDRLRDTFKLEVPGVTELWPRIVKRHNAIFAE